MSNLKNSSEILESAALLEELLGDPKTAAEPKIDFTSFVSRDDAVREIPEPLYTEVPEVEAVPVVTDGSTVDLSFDHIETIEEHVAGEFRGDKLEDILQAMCQRSGITGSLIADINGLPVASYGSPVENEVLAAFASVLGETMDKAAYFLDQHDANYVSVDINYADKAVVKKFIFEDAIFYLIVIGPKHINERGEINLAIELIKTVLSSI